MRNSRVTSVPDIVAAHAAGRPAAEAIVDGARHVSYGELVARADSIAGALRAQGVTRGSVVAVFIERSADAVIAFLAVLRAGAAYLAVEPSLPADRVRFLLDDGGAAAVVCRGGLRPALTVPLPIVAFGDQAHGALAPKSANEDDLAYVIYTSGSTGTPKGVAVTHGGLSNLVHWHCREYRLSAGQRTTQLASLAFDASVWEIWPTLAAGATLHVVDESSRQTPSGLVHYLADQRIDVSFVPTPLAEAMLEEAWPERLALRAMLTGGDKLRRPPRARLPFRLVNHYGPTESTVVATCSMVRTGGEAAPPIGLPIDGIRAHVLDTRLESVSARAEGELLVGGAGLARGYLGRPDLTADRFVPDPTSPEPGARLYRTGDLVRMDNELHFIARVDRQLKIRGQRIEPAEIELQLEAHSAIAHAVVVGREDGAGNKQLVAYVVPRPGARLSVAGLRDHLASVLPDALVPAAIVTIDSLPLNASGKVDRAALPPPPADAYARAGAPDDAAAEDETVVAIAQFFEQLLGVEGIRSDDNFFLLGGHSLLVNQLLARLRQRFGAELPFDAVYEAPTVAELAERVRTSPGAAAESLVTPVPRDGDLELSFGQEAIWFEDQLDPGNPAYNVLTGLRVTGALDLRVLADAFRYLIARHEPLRTTIVAENGRPRQRIASEVPFDLAFIDASSGGPEAGDAAARAEALRMASAAFDLARDRPLRAAVVRLSTDEHAILVVVHHIAFDAWSTNVFMRELGQCYVALREGQPPRLPSLVLQYADFCSWQRRSLGDERLAPGLRFWRDRLAGAPSRLELPADRPRPRIPTYRAGQHVRPLQVGAAAVLLERGRQRQLTPFVTLLVPFTILLARYSGQQDIVIGTPNANRSIAEAEQLLGYFVNPLVLRVDLEGARSFSDVLERVAESTRTALEHQDVPFERVVDALRPSRESDSTLFQIGFVVHEPVAVPMLLPALASSALDYHSGTTRFEITLAIEERRGAFVAVWNYHSDVYDSSTIERMADSYDLLLERMASSPESSPWTAPLLPARERRRLLVGLNDTERAWGGESVLTLFEEAAKKSPDSIAVESCGDHGSLTYRELDARSNQLARRLRELGAGSESVVGLRLDRSPELIVAIVACLKAGAAWLPLESDHPPQRLAFMMDDASVKIVIGPPDPDPPLRDSRYRVGLESQWQMLARHPDASGDTEPCPSSLSYVIYTSGSTGAPKGAMNTREGLFNRIMWMQQVFPLSTDDRVLHKTPIGFDVSVWELVWPLCFGARIVVAQPGGHRDSRYMVDAMETHGVSIVHFVPSMLDAFLEEDVARCTPLRHVIASGEALRMEQVERFQKSLGAEIENLYGPTEASIDATYGPCPRGRASRITIGQPIANMQAHVLDPMQEPVPIGVAGELFLGGVGLARGYVARPDLTADRFVPEPFGALCGARLYRTGDIVRRLADGNIEYVGRADFQVKLRGLRIELGEIEAVLERYPGVDRAVVVIARESAGDPRLLAYIVGRGPLDTAALSAHLRRHVPWYMVPQSFVSLDALPLTASGKIDRKALPSERTGAVTNHDAYEAPRTAIERQIAAMWVDLLGLDRVGVHDDFFECGGHSLLLIRVAARIRTELIVDVPLRRLFDARTVARMAVEVSETLARLLGEEAGTALIAEVEGMSEAELDALLADDAQG